ncbi:MAG: site-2 protease family protein [Candidatus Hydrothermarchaeaceae archaeon]
MSILLFFGIVAVSWLFVLQLEKMGKLGAERHAILLIFRTERGKGFISRVAKHKRFWKVFGSVGVAVGILGMLLVIFSLVYSMYSTYVLRVPMEGARAVIPGVTIPFWYGIIGLITVLIIHEFSHGIVAKSEDVSIKTLGALFITIIPIGAFVEPDEEELKAKKRISRMRIYAAGSFGNILAAIFAVILMISLSAHFLDTSVVEIGEVLEDSPAEGILEKGMILDGINGRPLSGPEDFLEVAQELKPNTDVTIKTDRGTFTIKTSENKDYPQRGFIGIRVTSPLKGGFPDYIFYPLLSSLYWIALLNQGIGFINLAPLHFGIAATDGHHLLKDIISKFGIKDAEKITQAISTTVLIVLAFTLLGPSYGAG